MSTDTIMSRARQWVNQDPDPATRAELEELIAGAERGDANAAAELSARFEGRIAFGTAGLRGALGAGPTRMNRVVTIQTAAGLSAFLAGRGAEPATAVVGYDARRNSEVFARDSAEVFAGAGMRVFLMPRECPTPVLAYAVRALSADVGVMVTASHNPPGDNGYKVFLGGTDAGSQIIAPTDAAIAAEIDEVAHDRPLAAIPRGTQIASVPEHVMEGYIAASATAVAPRTVELVWAYTAMHGVGASMMRRLAVASGFPEPVMVTAQERPDSRFPTLAYPNPEEPGALDLGIETARTAGADVLLANDPDADRLGVAAPSITDGWQPLTGNQIGLLLGWRTARRMAGSDGTLVCSVVSSPGLAAVAEASGLGFVETLSGFKWISRVPGLVYGFEEALGYLVDPQVVGDKDGMSAGLAVLEMVAEARAAGHTLHDVWREFCAVYGWHLSDQVVLRVADSREQADILAGLRTHLPTQIGGVAVNGVDDLSNGGGDLPPSNVLRFRMADGSRVIVRPSGTEPKVKIYLDVHADTQSTAAARLTTIRAGAGALVEPR